MCLTPRLRRSVSTLVQNFAPCPPVQRRRVSSGHSYQLAGGLGIGHIPQILAVRHNLKVLPCRLLPAEQPPGVSGRIHRYLHSPRHRDDVMELWQEPLSVFARGTCPDDKSPRAKEGLWRRGHEVRRHRGGRRQWCPDLARGRFGQTLDQSEGVDRKEPLVLSRIRSGEPINEVLANCRRSFGQADHLLRNNKGRTRGALRILSAHPDVDGVPRWVNSSVR